MTGSVIPKKAENAAGKAISFVFARFAKKRPLAQTLRLERRWTWPRSAANNSVQYHSEVLPQSHGSYDEHLSVQLKNKRLRKSVQPKNPAWS